MSYTTDHTTAPTSGAREVDIWRHRYRSEGRIQDQRVLRDGAFVAAVLFATYLDSDSLAREDGWRFAAFAVVAYIISRGLAKLGVRHPSDNK